jgi:hypothetical protein
MMGRIELYIFRKTTLILRRGTYTSLHSRKENFLQKLELHHLGNVMDLPELDEISRCVLRWEDWEGGRRKKGSAGLKGFSSISPGQCRFSRLPGNSTRGFLSWG